MEINPKQTLIGGGLAFLLAMSCCWVPWLAILLGGATGLTFLTDSLEKFTGVFMFLGVALFLVGGYLLINAKKKKNLTDNPILSTVIACPFCKHKQEEQMPTDACQFFYECSNCSQIIKPKEGDCCVYCSYGTVPCPPIQIGESCC